MASQEPSTSPSVVDEKQAVESQYGTAKTVPEIDHVAERKLVRKLDLWIIPPVMLLYLFSFLDRVNIGNARLYGLESDLDMHGDQFQVAVSILFVTYILSELPSNLVIKKFTPSRWLGGLSVAWGIVATLTGVVQSYGGLIACRLILGGLEGGLFPGLTIYLTLFYTRREIALRVGYLFVSAAISGSVGGLLAYGIGYMDGVAGQRGWRWIMIIEGIPTFLLGITIFWWLANDPETAHYLTLEEKQLMIVRKERQTGYSRSADEFLKKDVIKGLKDWKIWVFCFGQFGADTILYGYSTFLPTIIKGLGTWTSAEVQCLTIPCYALGAITYLVAAWISDRLQRRGVITVIFGLVSVIGYAVLLSDVSNGVRYFGCFLVAMGLYVVVGIPLGWLPSSESSSSFKPSILTFANRQPTLRQESHCHGTTTHHRQLLWHHGAFPLQDGHGTEIHSRTRCQSGYGWICYNRVRIHVVLPQETESEKSCREGGLQDVHEDCSREC